MLKIRGHHLLCIPRYYHGGYSKAFACRHKKVCMMIRKNPSLKIKLVERCDDLCSKCPFDIHSVCMKSTRGDNDSVLSLDNIVFKKLGLKKNSIHIAKDIFNKSINKIKSVKGMCNDCSYYKSCIKNNAINNAFVRDLNRKLRKK